MDPKPRFSKNADLRDLQIRFVDFASSTDVDDEWLDFVAREAAGGAYPIGMIQFVFRWALRLDMNDFLDGFLKLLRRLEYDHPKLDEIELRWLWAGGWRELAMERVSKACQRWRTDWLRALEGAMREMLDEETPEELEFRKAHLESIPKDQRPHY